MHILFVIDSLRPGGAQRQLVELIRGLDKSRYKMSLVVNREENTRYKEILQDIGVPIYCFQRKNRFDISPLIKIIKFIRDSDVDVVHPYLVLGSIFGVTAARITAKKVVCCAIRTAYDANLLEKVVCRLLPYFCDYFVSNSESGFKNRFRKISGNFRIIRNGIDLSSFKSNWEVQKSIVNELQLDGRRCVIGKIASLSHKKDHETFLCAAHILLQKNPNLIFLVVGKSVDNRLEELKYLSQQLGIQDSIVFTGYRPDVEQLIQLLDIVVLLTQKNYAEGMPNAVIEGMAAKKPVIATRGGGTDEIIQDGVNGILVTPASPDELAGSILKLIRDRALASKLAKNGRLFVEQNLGMERYIKQYDELYQNLVR